MAEIINTQKLLLHTKITSLCSYVKLNCFLSLPKKLDRYGCFYDFVKITKNNFYASFYINERAMKKTVLILSALVLFSCGNKQDGAAKIDGAVVNFSETANGASNKDQLPVIKFTEVTYDFGKIIQGEKVSHKFAFSNEGKSNLIITSAKGSCGCTIAEPTKEPIPPGGNGTIDVVFDSNGKQGTISKSVSVLTNCEPNTVFITITGNVIVPGESAEKK